MANFVLVFFPPGSQMVEHAYGFDHGSVLLSTGKSHEIQSVRHVSQEFTKCKIAVQRPSAGYVVSELVMLRVQEYLGILGWVVEAV